VQRSGDTLHNLSFLRANVSYNFFSVAESLHASNQLLQALPAIMLRFWPIDLPQQHFKFIFKP